MIRIEHHGFRCITLTDYEAAVVSPERMMLDPRIPQHQYHPDGMVHGPAPRATALRPEDGFGIKWRDLDVEKGPINAARCLEDTENSTGRR
jgi:hypothetical protein